MKTIVAIAALVLLLSVSAKAENDEDRKLAGQQDMSKDYLERVTDERAAEKLRQEEDRRDHEKYLRSIRGR